MLLRAGLLITSLSFVPNAYAGNADRLCTAGGYYSGAHNRFLSGLAMHILQERGQLRTKRCGALWQSAFDIGKRYSQTGEMKSSTDTAVLVEATAFRAKVYSAVAKNAGY